MEVLVERNRELQTRLDEAEETLRAIRSGEVDALVATGPDGDAVYTLKGADEVYRLLVQQMAEGAMTLSADGIILFANDQVALMLGLPLERIIGSSIYDFVPLDKRKAIQQLLSGSRGTKSELQLKREDGHLVPVYLSAGRLNSDAIACVTLVITDLTEQKRNQQAVFAEKRINQELERRVRERTAELEAANKELEAFAYSVSHDLRAPLRGIDGWSLALAEDYASQLDETAHTYLNRVRSEAQRMGLLIDDLLQLSRITRWQIEPRTVDLSLTAHTVAARLIEANPDRHFEFVISPGLTCTGDGRLLEIALTNLLNNAVKFTRPRPQTRIHFGVIDSEGERVFQIRDNGVGFDMAYAGTLFGAFQRLHRPSEFPGTGIGLATVHRIIRRHGGRIWAEARPDEGATFSFTLSSPLPPNS